MWIKDGVPNFFHIPVLTTFYCHYFLFVCAIKIVAALKNYYINIWYKKMKWYYYS
jgi:hypothetical protein